MIDKNKSDFDFSDDFADDVPDNSSAHLADDATAPTKDPFFSSDDPQDEVNDHVGLSEPPPHKTGSSNTFVYGLSFFFVVVAGYLIWHFGKNMLFKHADETEQASIQRPVRAALPAALIKSAEPPKTTIETAPVINLPTPSPTETTKTVISLPTPVPTETTKTVISLPAQNTAGTTTLSLNKTGQTVAINSSTAANMTELNAIKQQMDNLNKNIDTKLDSSLTANTAIINELRQQNQQLLTYTQGVSQQIGVLATQVKKQQEVLNSLVVGTMSSIGPNNGLRFRLDALIPGRAWLRTNTDDEITVSVGDMLPGYGKVIAIDPKSGTLTTDSGAVLHQ